MPIPFQVITPPVLGDKITLSDTDSKIDSFHYDLGVNGNIKNEAKVFVYNPRMGILLPSAPKTFTAKDILMENCRPFFGSILAQKHAIEMLLGLRIPIKKVKTYIYFLFIM